MTSIDILEHVVLRVPCVVCDSHYDVPVSNVLESQQLIRESERMWDEGCPNYCREATCEPLTYASLIDDGLASDAARSVTAALQTLTRTGFDLDLACG